MISMKVQKWGNSLGIRIPGPFAEQLNIGEGSEIELQLLDGQIVLRPLRQKPSLDKLLAGITPENRHNEMNFGKPEGNEML
jgi:antitoxin MazE